jgi:hypothetical protein
MRPYRPLFRALSLTPTNRARFRPTTTDSLTPREPILYAPSRWHPSCGRGVTPQQHGVSPSYTFVALSGRSGSALGLRGPSGWHLERPRRSVGTLRLPAGDQSRRRLAAPQLSGARTEAPETRNPRNGWHRSRVVTLDESVWRGLYPPPYQLSPSSQVLSRQKSGEVCLGEACFLRDTKGRKEVCRADAIAAQGPTKTKP